VVGRGERGVDAIVPPVCVCGLINPPVGATGVVLPLPSEPKSSKPSPLLCLITPPPLRAAFSAAAFSAFANLAAFLAFTSDTAFGTLATVPAASAVLNGLFDTASNALFTKLLFVLATTLPPVKEL